MTRVLVLGGNRSGKSAFAESMLAGAAPVEYVATGATTSATTSATTGTAAGADAEWIERVRAHRERRPAEWRTVETGDVAGVLAAPGAAVLVDSITGWLARTMDECGCWGDAEQPGALCGRVERLCSAWASTTRSAVAVTDEVGLGIVPDTPSGRRFRDALGALNQRLAAAADEVHLVVAGVPLRLR